MVLGFKPQALAELRRESLCQDHARDTTRIRAERTTTRLSPAGVL
jgi:hypothetical protein